MSDMTLQNFITCDLLDDNPECQVCAPNMEGKRFFSYGGNTKFGGEVVTVKCFEDNSRVKELLATNGKDEKGNGKVLVVDGGASMRCALLGDMIAQSGVDNGWAGVIVYGCVRDVWAKCQSAYKRSAPFPANPIARVWARRISKSALAV